MLKINTWARRQTFELFKKIILFTFALVLPFFLLTLFYLQRSTLESSVQTLNSTLAISLQTGDLISIDKALASLKENPRIAELELSDNDGSTLRTFSKTPEPFLVFKKTFRILTHDNTQWGQLSLGWTLDLSQMLVFVIGLVILFAILYSLAFRTFGNFSRQLVESIESFNQSSLQADTPHFISTIDELNLVFQKLKRLQHQEIQNEKLKQQQITERAISDLSKRVAHDIRSPISALRLVLSLITVDSEKKRLLDASMDRISDICKELLNEAKKSPQRSESVETALQIIVDEKRALFADSIEIDFNSCERTSAVYPPDHEFKSVLSNLLNNALEACSPKQGRVEIHSIVSSDHLKISIRDNGKGIPDDVLNSLGNQPLTFGKSEGNGLGFYNAKKWAIKHKGQLQIKSALGSGTEVELLVPTLS